MTSALDLLAVCVPLASCTAAVGCFRKSSRFFRGAGERPDTEPELSREGDRWAAATVLCVSVALLSGVPLLALLG